ncbi:MAG: class I SAM-dependent methyltransferase [Minisyncoccia bacterium]
MIEKQQLQKHYADYATRSDDRVRDRERAKRSIVTHVLKNVPVTVKTRPIKVVVLGASDKRYIPVHAQIFTDILGENTVVSTLDVDAEHLGSGADVVQHDVTKPFPHTPYGVVFSHELMKFLTNEEQLQVLENSYDALEPGGVAMHIMHEASIKGTDKLESWQTKVDPDELVKKLDERDILAKKLVFDSETAIDWMRETTVIATHKPE